MYRCIDVFVCGCDCVYNGGLMKYIYVCVCCWIMLNICREISLSLSPIFLGNFPTRGVVPSNSIQGAWNLRRLRLTQHFGQRHIIGRGRQGLKDLTQRILPAGFVVLVSWCWPLKKGGNHGSYWFIMVDNDDECFKNGDDDGWWWMELPSSAV